MVDWDRLDLNKGDSETLAGLVFLRKTPVRPVNTNTLVAPNKLDPLKMFNVEIPIVLQV